MRALDIITKKRDGKELSQEEINFFGSIPDYQAAAWTMAVLINGMTSQETTDLTMAMVNTGDVLDLSQIAPCAVDKHSSGGVGDKTTLVVEPLVAACGLPVGKMSGRGLGFSGGTLDKMESIPGFRVDLTTKEFLSQLDQIGLVLTGQSADLAPADGKFYALRDVSGTVDSIPLIASSIMSKKIAAGAQAVVLDRKAVALISDMNQPLGIAVGNALEVKEAIDTLEGKGPESFVTHCLGVAEQMLVLGKAFPGIGEAREAAESALKDGSAWQKFLDLVNAQGGDIDYAENPDKLPRAEVIKTVQSPETGYLSQIHARIIGETAVDLGAGRQKKGDQINHAVGIEILREVGDRIEKGDDIFIIHAADQESFDRARERLISAHQWSDSAVDRLPLVYDIIS